MTESSVRHARDRIAEGLCAEPMGIPGQCSGCKRNRELRPEVWSATPDVAPQVRDGVCKVWLPITWGEKESGWAYPRTSPQNRL
jgi:hypothetical protein